MLQPKLEDEDVCNSAEEGFWIVEKVKRSFYNQYEIAIEEALRQAQTYLDLTVKKGQIGQPPYNDKEKLKISNAFVQTSVEIFRNVVKSNFDSNMFDIISKKISNDITTLTSDINTFEVDIDLAIELKLSDSYRDIAKPVLVIVLTEYQNAIQRGEKKANQKLKMTDNFRLRNIVELFRTEIRRECKGLDPEIKDKVLEKIRVKSENRMVDESSEDHEIVSALPIKALQLASSLPSFQRNTLANSSSRVYESNNAVQHPFTQLSSSSSAVSGQKDETNVATNNPTTPDYVTAAPLVSSSSSIVEGGLSGKTLETARSSKRARLTAGSYSHFFDDERENLRQFENSLCARNSDGSYEDCPVSRPSTSTKKSNKGLRYNYEERVNDLLGPGIKVLLTKNNSGSKALINLGSGRKLVFYFSKYMISVAKLKYGEQVYIKLRLGPDLCYLTGDVVDENGRGRGARLLLSKEKFEQSNGTNKVQKMHRIYVDSDRAECVRIIHEIVTARSNSA